MSQLELRADGDNEEDTFLLRQAFARWSKIEETKAALQASSAELFKLLRIHGFDGAACRRAFRKVLTPDDAKKVEREAKVNDYVGRITGTPLATGAGRAGAVTGLVEDVEKGPDIAPSSPPQSTVPTRSPLGHLNEAEIIPPKEQPAVPAAIEAASGVANADCAVPMLPVVLPCTRGFVGSLTTAGVAIPGRRAGDVHAAGLNPDRIVRV